MPNNHPTSATTQAPRLQVVRRKRITEGEPPAILPVVEMISHRWQGGATIRDLVKRFPGMGQERVEACARYGMAREINALREALHVARERKAA